MGSAVFDGGYVVEAVNPEGEIEPGGDDPTMFWVLEVPAEGDEALGPVCAVIDKVAGTKVCTGLPYGSVRTKRLVVYVPGELVMSVV